MSLFGPPNVEKLSFKGDVPGLLKALTYPKDAGVRQAAASALGRHDEERSVVPLVDALSDPAIPVRKAAADALGSINIRWATSMTARSTVPKLVGVIEGLRTLEDREDRISATAVRTGATKLLGKIRDDRAIDALLEAVQRNRDETVRYWAADLLGEIRDPRAIKPLLGALIDRDYSVCKAAARALTMIDSNWTKSEAALAAVPMFMAALKESGGVLETLKATPDPEIDYVFDADPHGKLRDHERKVRSQENNSTIAWAAKEALKLVGALPDEPGAKPGP